jgi:hypothetical protein
LSGLRINGSDTGNTIYQATGDMGITTNTTNINSGMNTNGVKTNITPTNTTTYNNLILNSSLNFKNDVWNYSTEGNQEIWYDKAGITIEDASPKIELSRTKKDERVFSVLG